MMKTLPIRSINLGSLKSCSLFRHQPKHMHANMYMIHTSPYLLIFERFWCLLGEHVIRLCLAASPSPKYRTLNLLICLQFKKETLSFNPKRTTNKLLDSLVRSRSLAPYPDKSLHIKPIHFSLHLKPIHFSLHV